MWYFAWLLGLGLAISTGIIGTLWLENQLSGQDRRND